MLLFHSIYTPVSSAGVNRVPTPPRAAVFISSLQRLRQQRQPRIPNSTLQISLIPLLPKSNRPPFPSDIVFHKASNHSEFLDRRGCGRHERERGAKKIILGVENKGLFLLRYQNCTVFYMKTPQRIVWIQWTADLYIHSHLALDYQWNTGR